MKLSRALSKSIGCQLIAVLLFAQFAVASYACPGWQVMGSMSNENGAGAVVAASMRASADAQAAAMPPGCDQLVDQAANLCGEHCHQGQQSADTAAVPAVSTGIATFLYPLPFEPQHSLGSGRFYPAPDARLDAAPEPPHAILHCVIRI